MGMKARIRMRLHSFILFGLMLIACTKAQSNPTAPSARPSISKEPSSRPSTGASPSSLSESPSLSSSPSLRHRYQAFEPTSSLEPTSSTQPTGEGLRPIAEWTMLVVNRFGRAFSDVVEVSGTRIDDYNTLVVTATNTTSVRAFAEVTSQPVFAMMGEAIIELNEWVDVSNYDKVQMLFWFFARRNQVLVETDRFVIQYVNRTQLGGESTSFIPLKTYQRGSGRFRRNDQWYLGRVIISTVELEAVKLRFQTFFPTSSKMILLDKFGILGYAREGAPTSGTIVDEQQLGIPNYNADSIVTGKTTSLAGDDSVDSISVGMTTSLEDDGTIVRGKTTGITLDDEWLSRQPLV